MKESNHSNEGEDYRHIVAIILIGAWIVGIGLLTYLFHIYLNYEDNPNLSAKNFLKKRH